MKTGPRRSFLALQAGKAGVGAVLAVLVVVLAGWPGRAETLALAGLLTPLLLVAATLAPIALDRLEQASLALFALAIGGFALLTGGILSPILLWLVLVPAEAALGSGRSLVVRAGAIAALVLVVLGAARAFGLVPVPRLLLPGWQLALLCGLAAIAQGAFIAAAAQHRQRSADAAAAQGAVLYRFLADNALDLITLHADDGAIRFASPASTALLGRAPGEIEGLALSALVHADDLAVARRAFMEASYFNRATAVELRLHHRNGHHVWTELRCRPASGGDIVAVTRDIAERKAQSEALVEARDAAEAANRAKSRFLANMSHELRTPLNAIIGFSEIMTREMFGALGARYQEYSRLIHESGSHLLELINGVLDMSKIEAGKFELYEELFDLEETAQSAVRLVSLAAARTDVRLVTRVGDGARLAFADRRAVKQILANLLSNGVKYTPPGGEVRLEIAADGAALTLSVQDTGIGIPPADLQRLGQPFEQVERAETRAKEGTGLGLALVKALTALHGGETRISSVLGEGTCVSVRLPFAAVSAEGTRCAAPPGAEILPFRGAA